MIQFTVEDVFLIKGRGVVVTAKMVGDRHGFRAGAGVRILRPDGTRIASVVRNVEVWHSCFSEEVGIGVLLDVGVETEAVPEGSVVALETS